MPSTLFRIVDEIGFMKEAARRGIDPIVLFIPDRDRASAAAWDMLRATLRGRAGGGDNEHVLWASGRRPSRSAAVQDRRAAGLPEIDHQPADLLVHPLPAREPGQSSELSQWGATTTPASASSS